MTAMAVSLGQPQISGMLIALLLVLSGSIVGVAVYGPWTYSASLCM